MIFPFFLYNFKLRKLFSLIDVQSNQPKNLNVIVDVAVVVVDVIAVLVFTESAVRLVQSSDPIVCLLSFVPLK